MPELRSKKRHDKGRVGVVDVIRKYITREVVVTFRM